MKKTISNYVIFAEKKNIRIESEFDLEDIMINADEEAIGVAVGNILSNAIKFSKENGLIKIEIQKEENTRLQEELERADV